MLRVVQTFTGKTASNSDAGDLNDFLRDVLVEVAGENYRQTMYEAMTLTTANKSAIKYDLDPPLRANERVMSGLFATAISKVALRSRTEARIDRPERDESYAALKDQLEDKGASKTRNGRVDYLAWHASRVIGIELKMASMNCKKPTVRAFIEKKWNSVVNQSKSVQNCLRARNKDDKGRYPNPISLALMVVVGRRSINRNNFEKENNGIQAMEDDALNVLASLDPKPTFRAIYTFPTEFRALSPRRKGKEDPGNEQIMYTPFVLFIAKHAVNSTAK